MLLISPRALAFGCAGCAVRPPAMSYGAVDSAPVRVTLYSAAPPPERVLLLDGGGGGRDNPNRGGSGGGGDDDDERNTPRGPLALYMHLLARYPLPTKVVSSTLIMALSDVIAQKVGGEEKLDWRRVLAMGMVGAILTAPLFHYLYEFLERWMPTKAGLRNTMGQLAVDQLLAAPVWLVLFFPLVALVERGVNEAALGQTRDGYLRDFFPSLLLTWKIFVPSQAISFAFLPIATRVLALNVVDLVYTAALSYISHKPHGVS